LTSGPGALRGLGGTVQERTVAKARAVLHAIFELADRSEYRDGTPVARTQAPKYDARQPVLLTDGQYATLIEECDDATLRLYADAGGDRGA